MEILNIEKRIVLAMCADGGYHTVIDEGINEEHFILLPDVFQFIKQYVSKYGDTPTLSLLSENFKQTEWPDNSDVNEASESAVLYDIDQLKKARMKRKLIKAIEEAADYIEEEEPEQAMETMLTKLHSLKHEQLKGSVSITDGEAERRLSIYSDMVEQMNSAGMIGIPTGINTYDEKIGGWLNGQFVLFIGRLGVGKSWVLMYSAWTAWKKGYRVLYLSPEMTVEETEFRFDAINARNMEMDIKNSDLALAKLPDARLYKEYLNRLQGQNRRDFITADSDLNKRFTISGIQSMIFEYKPDVVCVDGVYLMGDEEGAEQSWQKMMHLGYGLKNIAMTNKVVVLASTQANREAAAKEFMTPKAHQIAYGDALAQAADKVFGIAQLEEGFIKIGTVKMRNGMWCPEIMIEFDVDSGNIKETDEIEPDGEYF